MIAVCGTQAGPLGGKQRLWPGARGFAKGDQQLARGPLPPGHHRGAGGGGGQSQRRWRGGSDPARDNQPTISAGAAIGRTWPAWNT